MERELKYDTKVCIPRLEFTDEQSKTKFQEDFDETYNVFMVEVGNLLEKYGVARVDVGLSTHLVGNHISC